MKINWICKISKFEMARKKYFLKHYRLRHGHGGEYLPCLYWEWCCSFKTWDSLWTHLSRSYSTHATVTHTELLSFKCPCCSLNTISTEREYFKHIGHHLKNVNCFLYFWKLFFQNKHSWNICLSLEPETHSSLTRWLQAWAFAEVCQSFNGRGRSSESSEWRSRRWRN